MLLSRSCRGMLPIVVALAVGVSAPVPLGAQLGGLRRAVERRVEKKAEEKVEDRITAVTLIPPTFDNRRIEITADRLDRYTAAMEKRKAALAANRQRYDALQGESSALREASQKADNPAERREFERADTRYRDCRRNLVSSIERENERQMEAFSAKMQANPVGMQNDPKVREMVAGMQALVQAQQAGDSAGVQRATARMQRILGAVTDSASIDRKAAPTCGVWPVRPRSMVTADSLSKLADAKATEANALLSMKGGVKGADVGLTDEQALEIWERILSWLNGVRDDAPITRTFTRAEYDLLVARRSTLKKAFANAE